MKIEGVDAFFLALPDIADVGDGSQDMVLIRVVADGHVGWGECEASPIPTIAALVTPPSHSACHGVLDSVLGQRLDGPEDITRIAGEVDRRSFDLLQAPHAWSGVEIALWDLLGRVKEEPVYRLLGMQHAQARLPYASVLFGDDPAETHDKARQAIADGFSAVKFGWGPFGQQVEVDRELLAAAREGLGPEPLLLVDAGTVFGTDVDAAAARLPMLEDAHATWLEEPFEAGAFGAYAALGARTRSVKLAGGEGSHNRHVALGLIDYGKVGYIQIDTGRIGGIGPARAVALHAAAHGVEFVNHTFTSHLALSASLQPFADSPGRCLCEYPQELSALAKAVTAVGIQRDADGLIRLPDQPGLGVSVDTAGLRPYLKHLEIIEGTTVLYRTPQLDDGV